MYRKKIRHSITKVINFGEAEIREKPFKYTAILIFFVAILMVSRRSDAIFNPQFWAEDGYAWYSDGYHHGVKSLLFSYNGYLTFTYRVFGYFGSLFSLGTAPLFYNLTSLFFQSIPVFLILSNRLNLSSKYIFRFMIALVYVSLINISEVSLNLTNIQWHLGIGSFLILAAGDAKNNIWKIFDCTVLLLTGLSGPLLLILFPVALYKYKLNKTSTVKMVFIFILSIIQLVSILFFTAVKRVGGHQIGDPIDILKVISGQIVTGGLLGEKFVDIFYGNVVAMLLVLFIFVIITIYILKNAPQWLKMLTMFQLIVLISVFFVQTPSDPESPWKGLTNPTAGQRYWYIPILCWTASIFWLALQKNKIVHYGGLLLVTIWFVGVGINWRLTPYKDYNFTYYVRKFEDSSPGERNVIPINPDWLMYLVKK